MKDQYVEAEITQGEYDQAQGRNSPRRIDKLKRRALGAAIAIVAVIGLLVLSATYIPGQYGPYLSAPTNVDDAAELARSYVQSLGYPDLAVKEVMEFQYNYYFIAYEKNTGTGAFEGVIEKSGGMMRIVHPEQGPNMMWNEKYGRMDGMMSGGWASRRTYGGVATAKMPVTVKDAEEKAQAYLDSYLPGSSTEDIEAFYGYYTIHVLKDGKIYGMLSVNGYTGQVWYHTWHGDFIQMRELD